jgi:hypothetical protein
LGKLSAGDIAVAALIAVVNCYFCCYYFGISVRRRRRRRRGAFLFQFDRAETMMAVSNAA